MQSKNSYFVGRSGNFYFTQYNFGIQSENCIFVASFALRVKLIWNRDFQTFSK